MPKSAPKSFDCVIIGGGPAGLSAAIYLSRARRSVLVVDAGQGRTNWNQLNENYLGFPNGIRAGELVKRGRKQAERFGTEFSAAEVRDLTLNDDRSFKVVIGSAVGDETTATLTATGKTRRKPAHEQSTLRARSLLFATGVTDVWPPFSGVERYVGKSLFWCIACDGFKVCGQRVVVLGNSDSAATTALQLLNYTPHVTFLFSDEQRDVSSKKLAQLKENNIPICQGRILKAMGKNGQLQYLDIQGGLRLELDSMFSILGQVPNSQLAARLGVHLTDTGCIKVDDEMKTNIPGVFAAGDVTNQPAQQIASAAHQGAMAGTSANYYLYDEAQRTLDIGVKPAE